MMQEVPDVVIAIPTGTGMVHMETIASVAHMVAFSSALGRRVAFPPLSVTSALIANSRNRLVDAFLEKGAPWLLFVDSDMNIPKDGLEKLLSRNRKVITGLYVRKSPPYMCVHSTRLEDGRYDHSLPSSGDLQEITTCGGGFLLIHKSVFKQIKKPYFFHPIDAHIDGGSVAGEDCGFCENLENAEIKIYLDPTVQLGHIGSMTCMPRHRADYERQVREQNYDKSGHGGVSNDSARSETSKQSLPA